MNKSFVLSERDDWRTPQDFFDKLNEESHFTLDAASSDANAKCEKHYTKEDDGLSKDWAGEVVFCNPPYCHQTGKWVQKCYEESRKPNTTVVMLIPSRTDTRYFHEFIYGKSEIRFIRGRLRFDGCNQNAPFASMVVVYR